MITAFLDAHLQRKKMEANKVSPAKKENGNGT